MRLLLLIAATSVAACGPTDDASKNKRPGVESTPSGAAPRGAIQKPTYLVFDDPSKALAHVLRTKPLVLGVGEYHERTDVPGIVSTLARFSAMFAQLKGNSSDFILETWVERGRCGAKEATVSKQIHVQLKRPKTTESEMRRLLQKSKSFGIAPHVLTMSCDDYGSIFDNKKQVDYGKFLSLVTNKLRHATITVLAARRDAARSLNAPESSLKTIVVYGGALHNDLQPYEGVDQWSYVKEVSQVTKGRYVELDLYVPEYIEGKKLLRTEDWYPVYRKMAAKDKVLLFQRNSSSYIMVMRKALAKTKTKTKTKTK